MERTALVLSEDCLDTIFSALSAEGKSEFSVPSHRSTCVCERRKGGNYTDKGSLVVAIAPFPG